MRINVRIAGAGGQGVILASVQLAEAYGLGEDFFVSQTQSYGPEARGGTCKAEVVISDENIDYMKVDEADVFVALNQAAYDKYSHRNSSKAKTLVNSTLVKTENEKHYKIPATQIAEEMGNAFVVNTVMLGALTKLLPKLHYPTVEEEIKSKFKGTLVGINLTAYKKGYSYMAEALEKGERG
ncbi:MAG: 2-oxoacid:acceptor oxidoreductase family protein [Anaerovoracaceae bacterium]